MYNRLPLSFHPPFFTRSIVPALVVVCAFATSLKAQQIVHVPSEQPTLQQAISAVSDGGIIELAAGTYNAPAGGFTIYDLPSPKAFTVRAASGAAVALSGGGTTDILRFAPSSFAAARPVTFVGINFAHGASTTNFIGGAITLVHAEVNFVSCEFQNNGANPSTTGGGALWIDSSIASFQSCTFSGNTSKNYGAAMSVVNSRVFLRDSRVTGNRVNLPGHSGNAAGGAMLINGSTVRIANCSFDNNEAGYVGGAIYTLGHWSNSGSAPAVDLLVSNSTFTGNRAERDPSVSFAAPAAGGAIHVEDETTARFLNCRFTANVARQGGAVSSYRAITEFEGCVFRANQATGAGGDESLGGALIVLSADNPDSTTNGGTINRRSAVLNMRDCLIQGATADANARQGGGIFIGGDLNAAYGLGGITQNGSIESNRAVATLTRVAFADISSVGSNANPGTGGAMTSDFTALGIDHVIVENCSATHFGGGFECVRGSDLTVSNTTFAGNSAGTLGGGIRMVAGALDIGGTSFFDNTVGSSENGAAITTIPDPGSDESPAADVSGTIHDSVFSNNTGGAAIYDADRSSAPFNRVQYSANQIFTGGVSAFFNDITGAKTVSELNGLTIARSSGDTPTVKAPVANTELGAAPEVGALLMLPPSILPTGAPGEALPIPAYLAFASTGGTASLDGGPQTASSAVLTTASEGPHSLVVGSVTSSTAPPPGAAVNISTRLPVGTGDNVLIGGFIILGPSPKTVVVRAIGPSLNVGGVPVPGTLQDPVLELHDAAGATIGNNNNWRTTQLGGVIAANQSVDIQASTVAPPNEAESAIVATLNPGLYTAVVRGNNGGTGIALVEVYDLDPIATSKLANISTRGFIQTGDNVMIGGFIFAGGSGATKVAVRAIGPSLPSVANALADPVLELHDSNGAVVSSNDDWKQAPNAADLQAANLAPTNDAESAILETSLARGPYTAIVTGKDGATGVGLVEVYVFE